MITELSRWRGESGLTQAEAAQLLGVSQTYFSLIERGVRPMTDVLRRRLAIVRAERLREQFGARDLGVVSGEAGADRSPEREHAHALLDLLTPERLTAVRLLLEVIVEPLENERGRFHHQEGALRRS